MKVNKSIKTIFYLPHYPSLLKQANLKADHTNFSKLCLLKQVIWSENTVLETESINNCSETRKVNKTIFYLTYPVFLLKYASFKTDNAHF